MNDLITREAALDAIDGMKPMQGNMEQLAMKALCWAAIKTIPAVDAAPVIHAYWIEKRWTKKYDWGCTNHFYVMCSACSNEIYKGMKSPYCPHCGAKMDGEGKEITI